VESVGIAIMKIKQFFVKLGSFCLPIMGGILGALGGAERSNKAFRRVFIPLALSGYAYVNLENIFVFTIMSMCGAFSIGYGIPDNGDEGSALGRFWMKIFKNNHLLADIFARGSIGYLIALSLISIPIIKHNWIIYLIYAKGIILTQALLSWRNLGQYTLFNRKLNWSETLTYGLITLFAVLIIKL